MSDVAPSSTTRAPTFDRATAPALIARDIRASYGRIEVLHGVDLEVKQGSVFALLGPNGAGKSTILKVMSGRLRQTSGTVEVFGEAPVRCNPETFVKHGVCAIPEGRGIFPNLTVADNIRMWTYQGSVSFAHALAVTFEKFHRLADRKGQLAGTLSGGEQQMLAIARALVGSPKLLLLDELSMGLAPLVVGELYETVGELASSGVTILVVEQFVSTVLSVATDAAIMVHGHIQRQGSPAEMADAALSAYLTK
jgi:branched-chain amino acid transport system ATP-binding protein